jgi:type I restriction enzyme R subunit
LNDFHHSRVRFGDKSIGAMVVCDSSEQARKFYEIFSAKAHFPHISNTNTLPQYSMAAEAIIPYQIKNHFTSALILHNEGDKVSRAAQIEDFKEGKIDFLFVYSMLLTGFDAPRLKKMYLGRKIKAHNLLQTLTRVNRPYKDFRMGYVVDFADISEEFDVTNRAYFQELNREYNTETTGENESDVFGSLFMSKDEIDEKIERIRTVLSDYSTDNDDNKELFSQQIQEITDRQKLLTLKNALQDARDIYNIARLTGYTELAEILDIKHLSQLLTEVSNRLQLLNLKEAISDVNSRELLNEAIEDVVFQFTKIGEEQLNMFANELMETACRTRLELQNNFHQRDPEWISLYDEFRRLLEKHKIDETNLEQMQFESQELKIIYDKIKELNRKNSALKAKFGGDRKFARIYKTLEPSGLPSNNNPLLHLLERIKSAIDERVSLAQNMMDSEGYFKEFVGEKIIEIWKKPEFCQKLDADIIEKLIEYVSREYFEEYRQAA